MRRPLFIIAALTMIGAGGVFAQSAPSPSTSEGLELLKQVAQHYAEAKSYYIELAEENTSSTEYSHSWQRTVLTAAEAPGNRFHYEGHANGSSAMKVADGKTVWIYRLDEHQYTAKPQPSEVSAQQTAVPMSEGTVWRAEHLIKQWSDLVKTLKSADRPGDAILMVNGHEVRCNVVHVQNSDKKRVQPNWAFDETIWIDKTSETVLRTIVHLDNYLDRIPLQEEIVTTFTTTELNSQVREALFRFSPPPDAKLIADFPDPAKAVGNVNLAGKPVPSLNLRSAEGKVVGNVLRATHRGELPIGDGTIPCAVLNDGTRVLTETGITNALLGGRSGASRRRRMAHLDQGTLLPLFVAPGNLKPFITEELMAGPLKPIIYLDGNRTVVGFEATVLPAVCDIWLSARQAGALVARQSDRAMKAEILLRGLARVGVIALVDEATGYQEIRDRFALQQILDTYIGKELAKWVKTFPDEFYQNVFRLRKWKFEAGSTKRPMMMAKLTADLVYSRLAPGVLEELRNLTPKDTKGRRKNKLFQRLSSDIGHPALRDHLSGVVFLLKASEEWDAFHRSLDRVTPQFGKTLLLPLVDDPPESTSAN
jgi:outer membrane lipoprotein-sorting protein